MTNFDGQTVAALVCVSVAMVVLVRYAVLWWRSQSVGGCGGGCHGCGANSAEQNTQPKFPLPVIEPPSEISSSKTTTWP